MVDFGGWELPQQYTSIRDEHLAVRNVAGLFDISHMGRLVVEGAGAEAYYKYSVGDSVAFRLPSGKEFRLRAKGVPYLNERGRGDLIVQVVVETPKKLTKAQREAIQALGDTLTVDNRATSRTLLDKMKDLFS